MNTQTTQMSADIGGTFTDVILELWDQTYSTKVLTTYVAPENAIIDGMQQVYSKGYACYAPETPNNAAALAPFKISAREGHEIDLSAMLDPVHHPALERRGGQAGAPTTIVQDDGTPMHGTGNQFVAHGRHVLMAFPSDAGLQNERY